MGDTRQSAPLRSRAMIELCRQRRDVGDGVIGAAAAGMLGGGNLS